MISRAYLIGPPSSDLGASVAGVPLFLRTLLHLQDAGVKRVTVRACASDAWPGAAARDRRVELVVDTEEDVTPTGPALVARLGSVWHPQVGKRLAHGDVADDEVRAAGERGSAIYVAGEEALPALIAALVKGETPTVTPEALTSPEFVITAKTSTDRRAAEKLLFRSLYKPTDGFVSRYLNRKLSLSVTRLLLSTSVTPNQMTFFAALFGIAGVITAWSADRWQLVLATLLVQTQSVLDGCDGEIARLKHLRSGIGEWLDQVSDDFVNIGFLVAVAHSLSQNGSWFARFAWPIAMITLGSHTSYQIGLYAALWTKGGRRGSVTAIRWRGQGPPKAPPTTTAGKRWFFVKKLFEDAGRRDFFTFAYVPCALLGVTEIAFTWHAIIATMSGILTTSQWLFMGGPESADS
ncbi:hypothetical protein BH09MYX1_BH09MYX1_25730 [soil metagenome]